MFGSEQASADDISASFSQKRFCYVIYLLLQADAARRNPDNDG